MLKVVVVGVVLVKLDKNASIQWHASNNKCDFKPVLHDWVYSTFKRDSNRCESDFKVALIKYQYSQKGFFLS